MRTSCVKNGLVVGVILLFIGVAIQPVIAIVEPESIEVGYFDVTTEFIGLDKNYTTQLTKEEIQELDALFDSFRSSLNNSVSYEDTVKIYNKMILKLDSYGLLGDCNLKQVQELVTGRFQKPIFNLIMNRLYDRIPVDNNSNIFCLISGSASRTLIIPPVSMIVNRIVLTLDYYSLFPILRTILFGLNFIRLYFLYPWYTLGGGIGIGYLSGTIMDNYYGANGWFNTYGLYGKKQWEDDYLYGHIFVYSFLFALYFIGVTGYTGIRIYTSNNKNSFYLGFASYVKIDNWAIF